MLKINNKQIKNSIIKKHDSNAKSKKNKKKISSGKYKYYGNNNPIFQSNQTVKRYIEKKLNEQIQPKEKLISENKINLYATVYNKKQLFKPKNILTATNSKNKKKVFNINHKSYLNKSHNKTLNKAKTLNDIKLNENTLSMSRNRIFNVNKNSLKKNKIIVKKHSNSCSTALSINENNQIKEKLNKNKVLSIYTLFSIDSLKQFNKNSENNNNTIYNNRYNNNLFTYPENIFGDLLEEKKPIDECPVPTPYVKKYFIATDQEIMSNKKNNNCIKSDVKNSLNCSPTTKNYKLKKNIINKISQNKTNSVGNYKNKDLGNIAKNKDKYNKNDCFFNTNLSGIPKKKKNCLKILENKLH